MDCEKFDQHVIDALYEELDEVTSLALRRHVESCARCGALWAGFVATRGAVKLTMEEPSSDLESRILAAERSTQIHAPWYRKALRGMAWAGSHAMRPQLAMAALFMLVIGSSLLLLRVRPGVVGSPVEVSEKGAPVRQSRGAADEVDTDGRWSSAKGKERKAEAGASPRSASPEAASDALPSPAPAATAMASANNESPADALSRAQALKQRSGCAEAAGLFLSLSQGNPASQEAEIARRELADCKSGVRGAPSAVPGSGAAGGGMNR